MGVVTDSLELTGRCASLNHGLGLQVLCPGLLSNKGAGHKGLAVLPNVIASEAKQSHEGKERLLRS